MSDLLPAVLDTLIPPSEDGRMPGAGAIGLADEVRAQTAESSATLTEGLAALEAGGFGELDLDGRVAAIRELETTQPLFVPTVWMAVLTAYYRHPKVLVGLGLEGRPPHPEGYPLEAGDLGALERVRARGKLYREA